ncbi:Bromodomain-containing protein [Phaeosphaeriaceae sp. PMI808]|nr:Bromodomain-containing protein [Phaeosphaeriaceae sp. PMI808]
MNTSVSAYTTLESLLLFQCLHAYGVGTAVFSTISDLLKKNPDIAGHKYFQSSRLSPDALRNFYLERLRKEIDHDQADTSEGHATNPRKRKKTSPPLPTVQESLQHQHLIPQLLNKLYVSYRNEATEHIRAEEEKYEKLQRELKSIERGEWDDQLQLQENTNGKTSASRSPTLPKKSPHLAHKPLQPPPPVLEPKPAVDQRRATTTPQPPPAASPSPQPNLAQPNAHPPKSQQPVNSPYPGQPYHASPFPPGQQSHNSPPTQPNSHHHASRPIHSQSPVADTPGPPLQPQPGQPYGNNGLTQYGLPPGAPSPYSPSHQRFPHPPPGSHSPNVQAQHQQQRPQFPHPPPQAHPHHAPQYAQPPPQAGFMLPPFQVAPQDPSRVHPQSTTTPQQPQVSTPVSNRQQPQPGRTSTQTPGASKPGIPPMHPLVTQARQNFSTPVNSRSPISATGTPHSAKSVWKKSRGVSETPVASPRPIPEQIDDFAPLATPKSSPTRPKSQRKSRGKAQGKEKESDQTSMDEPAPETTSASELPQEDSVTELETRSGRSRRKAAPKRAGPGSIASSRAGGSARDRSRSQSILSHTDTVADPNESQAGNRIKSERGNSVDAIEEESVGTPSQVITRRRGVASRRKRNAREASLEEAEDHFSTPGPLRTISAPRFFARTCAPIMNDIQSHKHASTFSAAVRAKDAEGYYDIIKRPTDLKSIQKAIGVGAKQVAAAASDTPVGSPGGGGGTVELPITVDNVPPKSIVNAAQLEKELMRMFVNAVMFNPGEDDGVVQDAREMFETVQRSVSTWRNVERSSGRAEVEDTPTVEDEEPPMSKRKKV